MTINRSKDEISSNKIFLTALIITYNEEHNIKNVLKRLEFCR
jgi:hypothetical protein